MQKEKSTGGLPPLGHFSMMANGWLWACYGYTAGMDLTIILPNLTGAQNPDPDRALSSQVFAVKPRLASSH